MKSVIIIQLLCVFISSSLYAQYPPKDISPYLIQVSYNKTSNLIFPFDIKSVDRGSAALLVQKASGVENILQIKAAQTNFSQTNLTVITSDGMFYSFLVDFTPDPSILNYSFKGQNARAAVLQSGSISDALFATISDSIQHAKPRLHQASQHDDLRLTLQNVFIRDNFLWFRFQITNGSLIPFPVSYARVLLRDKATGKRTAIQEEELTPVTHTAFTELNKDAPQTLVFVFNAFTIPDSRQLLMQFSASGSSRTITLNINRRAFRRIQVL